MKSITFELPPSPRCVVQRRTVVLRVQDAWALYMTLRDHFDKSTAAPPADSTAGDDGQADSD